MDNEQLNQVLSYLDKIGEKIGTTGKQIWPWLVKQQYIDAIVSAVFFVLFLVLFLISLNKFLKLDFEKFTFNVKENLTVGLFIVFCLGLFTTFVVFCAEFFDIFNPQYWALKDLLMQIK